MDPDKTILFNKLISIEMLVSDIYLRFSEIFEDDREFWWRLSVEERGHASLLKSGLDTFGPMNLFPKELLSIPMDEVDKSIAAKDAFLRTLEVPEPRITRVEALTKAAEMESGDIEGCFQNLMDNVSDDSRVHKLFRLLNKDSAEHAHRIRKYLDLLSKR